MRIWRAIDGAAWRLLLGLALLVSLSGAGAGLAHASILRLDAAIDHLADAPASETDADQRTSHCKVAIFPGGCTHSELSGFPVAAPVPVRRQSLLMSAPPAAARAPPSRATAPELAPPRLERA